MAWCTPAGLAAHHQSRSSQPEPVRGLACGVKEYALSLGVSPLAPLQGPTESSVKAAKAEIKRILEDSTERAMRREAGAGGVAPGRYSIV
jgi:hypothetical protein